MARPSNYPAEFRERAVWLVFESTPEHPTQWAAIMSISEQLGVNHETLLEWVRQAEADSGRRPGPTSEQLEGADYEAGPISGTSWAYAWSRPSGVFQCRGPAPNALSDRPGTESSYATRTGAGCAPVTDS
jgi:transposase-like protein